MESYTTRQGFGGRTTTTHDLNPLKSWTTQPTLGGGYKIQNTFNPLDSYTARPLLGGRGVEIQKDFAPLNSIIIRTR